jgi:probable HAF family extracellular repeat protein
MGTSRRLIPLFSLLAAPLVASTLMASSASAQWSAIELGVLAGGTWSDALGINDRQQIVGVGGTASGATHALLWQHGMVTDLGVLPGGGSSIAHAINKHGEIVGQAVDVSGVVGRAVLWTRGGIADLGTLPGGTQSAAFAINDRGIIVGTSNSASGEWRAVSWQNGLMSTDRRN